MDKYILDETEYSSLFITSDSEKEQEYNYEEHEFVIKEISIDMIANYFIAYANITGDYISNLKLQKLVYYSQAWHLVKFDKPFFDAKFEAWVHGPVNSKLYGEYKRFRWKPIEKNLDESYIKQLRENIGEDKSSLLDEIIDEYFTETAYTLEILTHSEEPWIEARKGLENDEPSNNIISEEIMKKYYGSF